MLINSNYVSFFKRTFVTPTDFCLSHGPRHHNIQSELHAERGGTSSSFFNFSRSFDFSHNLEIKNL